MKKYLKDNSPELAEVVKIRQKIEKLKSDIHALETNPLSEQEVRQRLESVFSDASFCRRGLPGAIRARGSGAITGAEAAEAMLPFLLSRVMGKELVEAGICLVKESGGFGVSPEKAQSEEKRLRDLLDVLERKEEAEIMKLEDCGRSVYRRPDARPEVILEIE